jgi:hypothetical protein
VERILFLWGFKNDYPPSKLISRKLRISVHFPTAAYELKAAGYRSKRRGPLEPALNDSLTEPLPGMATLIAEKSVASTKTETPIAPQRKPGAAVDRLHPSVAARSLSSDTVAHPDERDASVRQRRLPRSNRPRAGGASGAMLRRRRVGELSPARSPRRVAACSAGNDAAR